MIKRFINEELHAIDFLELKVPQRKRPRLADVARLTGVSEATVSVVLNNRVGESARVSEETQQRIWDAVRQLGYVANPLARSLAGGRNKIIAVFTFEAIFPIDHRNFYYPFLIGIEEEASRLGYDLLLVTSPSDGTGKRHIFTDGVNRLQVADGAILLGFEIKDEVIALLDEEFPFVFVGRRDSPGDRISYVAADYTTATAEIVDFMIEQGHYHIAYLQSTKTNEASQDRKTGYVNALAHRGYRPDPSLIWRGTPDKFSGKSLQTILDQGATAIIAEDDALGNRLLDLANDKGLRCPEDFSLAVLGDPLSMLAPHHSWTTFTIPRREMGAEALRLLINQLDGGQEERLPYRSSLACTFVPGETTGPPSS